MKIEIETFSFYPDGDKRCIMLDVSWYTEEMKEFTVTTIPSSEFEDYLEEYYNDTFEMYSTQHAVDENLEWFFNPEIFENNVENNKIIGEFINELNEKA